MKIEDIISCIHPKQTSLISTADIRHLATDSRKIISPEDSLFIALTGPNFNGHDFLNVAFEAGIRNFLVSRSIDLPDSNILVVEDTLQALQDLSACHRKKFSIPVVAITGSNGKTIIKDWISQLLGRVMSVCSNPLSYNSQVGVPLSIWNLNESHQMGVFEAGISRRGEMEQLEKIIQPTLGIFANLGSAHDDGFADRREKLREKLKLFEGCEKLIVRDTQDWVFELISSEINTQRLVAWGKSEDCQYVVQFGSEKHGIRININGLLFKTHFLEGPFLENLTHCIITLLHLGVDTSVIQEGISSLEPVPMRLEIKNGIRNTLLIDDTYNNDLTGISYAVDFLRQQKVYDKKVLILSDVINGEVNNPNFSSDLLEILEGAGLNQVVLIGPRFYDNKLLYPKHWIFFETTEQLLNNIQSYGISNSVVLIKGARPFKFERIVFALQEKIHETILEINLNALVENLNWFRQHLEPKTKLMAMVKASAYGSGSLEIATSLQYNRVDYFGVAYVDEGVALRQAGIQTPILVLNAPAQSVDLLCQYDLESEVYSLRQLKQLIAELNSGDKMRCLKIHLNLETGMNRLGIEEEHIEELIDTLLDNQNLKVQGIMSHLVGSDDPEHEAYTRQQAVKFHKTSEYLSKRLQIKPIRHLLNSAGIISYPEYQYEMVRLGIGLYGIDSSGKNQEQLTPIGRLTSRISQIKNVKKGNTVGYSRKGVAHEDMRIATIAIGYSDGFPRALSGGVGSVWIKDREAKVVGNVCMDMTMVDVTQIDASEGDEVLIFGDQFTIGRMADSLNTIPYEILTGVSDRVKRRFVYK